LLPDGGLIAGAKRGGMTDHISGPHLIPNCGREAMVPAECVRRQRPVKKVVQPPPQPKAHGREAAGKKKNRGKPGRARSQSRSRDRSRDRSEASDRSEEERLPARSRSEEATIAAEDKQLKEFREQEAREAEDRRRAEEVRKLNELADARRRKQELDEARKKKLGGMFAMGEDDSEDEDTKRARDTKERARAEERRLRERQEGRTEDSASSSSALVAAGGAPRLQHVSKGDVATALDIDGHMHEHKFSKVWKDWDASKRDDPGEIARQFMKVSAIKRRGYAAPSNRSRSRSRGGRR